MWQHSAIKSHYWYLDVTDAEVVDLLSASGRRPQWPCSLTAASMRPHHHNALYLCDPIPARRGVCGGDDTGAAEMDSMITWEACGGGFRGMDVWAGLIRRPQQVETDPSFTLSMRGRPTISPADTKSLISQLISGSEQRSLDWGTNSTAANQRGLVAIECQASNSCVPASDIVGLYVPPLGLLQPPPCKDFWIRSRVQSCVFNKTCLL